MNSPNQIAAITAAIGDPARVNMLMSLRFDRFLTSGELARVGNVAPSTASEHLARMASVGLIVSRKDGRQRVYSLADSDVCDLLDSVAAMAERHPSAKVQNRPLPVGLLHSRLCYDHLAGKLGCQVTAAMFQQNLLAYGPKSPEVTVAGQSWLERLGIDISAVQERPRCALRLCPDWTEGGHHLGGGLASAMLEAFRQRDWLRTRRGDLEVHVTPVGIAGFREFLGLQVRQVHG